MKKSVFKLLVAILFITACGDSGTGCQKYDGWHDVPDCDSSREGEHIYVWAGDIHDYEEWLCKYEPESRRPYHWVDYIEE